jgi:hypothetical protein
VPAAALGADAWTFSAKEKTAITKIVNFIVVSTKVDI